MYVVTLVTPQARGCKIFFGFMHISIKDPGRSGVIIGITGNFISCLPVAAETKQPDTLIQQNELKVIPPLNAGAGI